MLRIPTHDMPRSVWLELRRKGLGGSDAASSCGLSKWKTRFELFLEKCGDLEEKAEDKEPEWFYWGRTMEEPIIQALRDRHDITDARPHKFMEFSTSYPWAFYDADGLVGSDGLLEIKLSRYADDWGPSGSDEIPLSYTLQVQHGMAVMNKSFAVLACLIAGHELRIYRIDRDQALIDGLMQKEREFWSLVESGTCPPFDHAHPTALDVLSKAYPGTNGEEKPMPLEADAWHQTYQDLCEAEKTARDGKQAVKALLLHAMGEAAIGRLGDGSAYTRKLNRAGRMDFRHSVRV
jgi:putative phage-type endonuclease